MEGCLGEAFESTLLQIIFWFSKQISGKVKVKHGMWHMICKGDIYIQSREEGTK